MSTSNFITDCTDCCRTFYSAEEHEIIDKYKDLYLQAKSPAARKTIAITDIFPKLFNYWSKHETIDDIEVHTQDLIMWIRNNWRPEVANTTKTGYLTVKRSDVVWMQQRDEVFIEIAALLGLEKANSHTTGWFSKRMIAIGNIISRMTDVEKEELDNEAARIAEQGYPEDERKRLAEKYATKQFDTSAKSNFLEMGLLTISFVARNTLDGQIAVEIHDQMAPLLGISAPSFKAEYPNQVKAMQKLVLGYVRTLQHLLHPTALQAAVPSAPATSVEFAEGGVPRIPPSLDAENLDKSELEAIFKQYISQHYYLATNRRTHIVLFTPMSLNMANYVADIYLPHGFIIKEPRNLRRQDIITFLKHVMQRQQTNPIQDVFRFKQVHSSRVGGEATAPQYTEATERGPKGATPMTGPKHQWKRKPKQVVLTPQEAIAQYLQLNPKPQRNMPNDTQGPPSPAATPQPQTPLTHQCNIINDEDIDPALRGLQYVLPRQQAVGPDTHVPMSVITPQPQIPVNAHQSHIADDDIDPGMLCLQYIPPGRHIAGPTMLTLVSSLSRNAIQMQTPMASQPTTPNTNTGIAAGLCEMGPAAGAAPAGLREPPTLAPTQRGTPAPQDGLTPQPTDSELSSQQNPAMAREHIAASSSRKVWTSDNLAALEAAKYGSEGKRQRVRRTRQ